mmetsp:Transcript_168985/g.543229  ORF Transcript_168985/g.543229 Transcript_168985/m.543229 type:complete len:112 (-) Transcript_168985:380-715(-)
MCWIVGSPGASCREACTASDLRFHRPSAFSEEPMLPHVLALIRALPSDLAVQMPWAPFECYVSSEGRFHLAQPQDDMSPDWSYPACELVCPCLPAVADEIMEAVKAVPDLD